MNIMLHTLLNVGFLASTISWAGTSRPQSEPVKIEAQKSEHAKPLEEPVFSYAPIVDKLFPAAVSIMVVADAGGGRGNSKDDEDNGGAVPPQSSLDELFREFFKGIPERERRPVRAMGSGFIIKKEKGTMYVVTNNHVVRDAKKVSIILRDRTEIPATVRGSDERTDIALLKIDISQLPTDKQNKIQELCQIIEWGDSDKIRTGDVVLAVGNPFGLGHTVTNGIVSSTARDVVLAGGSMSRRTDYVDDFIQHSAQINVGNSGGILADLRGKVIGINTAIFSPSGGNVGVGFAIPSNVARDTVDQLMELGRTKRGWLGVHVQPIFEEHVKALRLKNTNGALVSSVTLGGPASKAKSLSKDEKEGLQTEDVIIAYNDKPVNDQNRLTRLVGSTTPGSKVKITVWRNAKTVDFEIIIEEFEEAEKTGKFGEDGISSSKKEKVEALGMVLSTIPESSGNKSTEKETGIYVADVKKYSIQESGISPGDIIKYARLSPEMRVDFTHPSQFQSSVSKAKELGNASLLLFVSRGGVGRFLSISLEEENSSHTESETSRRAVG